MFLRCWFGRFSGPAPGMVVGRDAACQPVWRDADMLVVRGGQELAAPSPAGLEVMRKGYGCTLYGIGIDDLVVLHDRPEIGFPAGLDG